MKKVSNVRQIIMETTPYTTRITDTTMAIHGTDLFQLDAKTYLLTVDVSSKYPIPHQLRNGSTSKIVINRLSDTLSIFGVPERL